jgi:hypothetical protein
MLYTNPIIESLGLQLPMILEVDNNGGVDLVNNYSVGGWTRQTPEAVEGRERHQGHLDAR